MKSSCIFCVVILFFIYIPTFSQITANQSDKQKFSMSETEDFTLFKYELTFLTTDQKEFEYESPIRRFLDSIQATKERFRQNNPKSEFEPLYPESSLNLLFGNKIGTAFTSSSDLTLQRAYFNLDAAEKSFSFGYNIDFRKGNGLKPLNFILNIGTKIVANEGFATISTGGDLDENNIGLNLKFSYVGNGKIGWKHLDETKVGFKNHRLSIDKNREFLYYKYNEKVKEFNSKKLPEIIVKNKELFGEKKSIEKIKKEVKLKSDSLLLELIREELNFVEKNNLYTSMKNWWVTADGYIPLGDKEYDITPILSNNKPTKAQLYMFNANLSYNFYRQRPAGFSYFGKIVSSIRGNSNIEVNGLKAKAFQSIITENNSIQLTEPVEAIPVDNYDKFLTTSIKAELAVFFKNNRIGFSPSIEKTFGVYDAWNWKLGIPLSLKDKEGKPTVNFELQWRETQTLTESTHLIGFSTSFFFGDLINKK